MIPKGGTELMYDVVEEHLGQKYFDKIHLQKCGCHEEYIDDHKKNIIWQQSAHDQPCTTGMARDTFTDYMNAFVFVSNWQYDKFREKYNVDPKRSHVIRNATYGVEYKPKPKGKIKLIYTSTPFRGLDVVVSAFELLNRDDIELDIFSSTKVYGTQFYEEHDKEFEHIYNKAKSIKGINYFDYATNDVIRQRVAEAHIFAYPSTFEETSCISAIEALMAGCQAVVTNYGALPETCAGWADYVMYDSNHLSLAETYAEALEKNINDFWSSNTQDKLVDQNKYYNRFYSWDVRLKEWETLFNNTLKEA
jgi:glycosyltransferase involved in cell wall biosynthesis